MKAHAELAQLSADAYLPDPTFIIGDDLAANVIRRDDAVIVAFRGTANPRGWLRDLDAIAKSHPLIGYCHHGFLTGACALMQRLDLGLEDKRIILTGHSLGGALAIVLGALRLASGERVDELVTFGAPRAGYTMLKSIWAKCPDVTQYRYGNDPVTRIPFNLFAFPYVHVRSLTRIGSNDVTDPMASHGVKRYAAAVFDLPEPGATAVSPPSIE